MVDDGLRLHREDSPQEETKGSDHLPRHGDRDLHLAIASHATLHEVGVARAVPATRLQTFERDEVHLQSLAVIAMVACHLQGLQCRLRNQVQFDRKVLLSLIAESKMPI